jgi:hypothetical protein
MVLLQDVWYGMIVNLFSLGGFGTGASSVMHWNSVV